MHPEVDSSRENAADLTMTAEQSEPEAGIESRPRRIRKKRNIADLNVCNCGDVVSPDEADVIECRKIGCETRWVSSKSHE